ncbi:terpenoid synthase [Penicillium canescens]|nr:terpenoid synthase [Penicillium canescens]KAJ6175285.1 terpenoid synthase [Penicillium canescens]
MSLYVIHLWFFDLKIRLPSWLSFVEVHSVSLKSSLTNSPKEPHAHKEHPKHYRQVIYAYDAIGERCEVPELEHDPFYFLDPQRALVPTKNAILIDPVELGLPWISTMKGSPQCIHWREAEAAGMELIEEILAARGAGAVIPERLKTNDKKRKMLELVETAVTICIYLYAVSDATRIRVLTKSILFLFLHDDVIESTVNAEGNSILEGWDTDTFQADELDGPSRNDLFLKFCRETIALDPVLGLELMQDTVRWARFSRTNSSKPGKAHGCWQDFVAFRELDIAYEHQDRPVFKLIEQLYVRHCLYVNDLYSYEKEYHEYQKEGAPLHNSVHAIEQALSVPPVSAKSILRSILWDCERQVREEYVRLMALPDFSEEQKTYLQHLIESFAGNYMYSSTTYRYARLSGKLIEPPNKECMLRDFI